MSDTTAAEKLVIVEHEVARVRDEYDGLRQALGDPKLTAWVDGRGRVAPRALTAFEMATVKRLSALRPTLARLEAAEAFLVARTLDEAAGKPSEGPDDPEGLLRAALVCLARAWQAGHRDVEHRVTLRAIAAYLKSLDEEP